MKGSTNRVHLLQGFQDVGFSHHEMLPSGIRYQHEHDHAEPPWYADMRRSKSTPTRPPPTKYIEAWTVRIGL